MIKAERIRFLNVRGAREAIEILGANNSELMATRAVHLNVILRNVPGREALFIKRIYNDIGAEAAISSQAYHEVEGAVTDMLVMGTLYQHREVRRVLADNMDVRAWVQAIGQLVENEPETVG